MEKEKYRGYSDKEKRQQYIREWNRKWRKTHSEEYRKYMREYYWKNRMKMLGKIRQKKGLRRNGNLYGTCGIGRGYELIALKLLKGSIDMNAEVFSGSYDLLWQGKKIEVKMRKRNKRNSYGFTTNKTCIADFYLLFCVDNKEIVRILFMHSDDYGTGLRYSLSGRSKYEKFVVFSKNKS